MSITRNIFSCVFCLFCLHKYQIHMNQQPDWRTLLIHQWFLGVPICTLGIYRRFTYRQQRLLIYVLEWKSILICLINDNSSYFQVVCVTTSQCIELYGVNWLQRYHSTFHSTLSCFSYNALNSKVASNKGWV